MTPDDLARRTLRFVNVAHALDHFVLLIFPTAVLAIAAERGETYSELIGLSTGAFVAFGLFALPVGWLADRLGRRNLLAAFFFGCGAACLGLATAGSMLSLALWLTLLGMFSAIYHPVGSAMLVSHARRLGRDLGVNGVWGNLGAASASGVTALITAPLGWRAGFIVPGLVCIAAGAAFLALVPREARGPGAAGRPARKPVPVAHPLVLAALFGLAILAGGMTFNMLTVALPKVLDERLGLSLPLAVTGTLATAVFVFGAMTQLLVGRLVDRVSLPRVFVGLSVLQPLGLALAALAAGAPLLVGLAAAMAAIYGQVVVNDAMIARYVPAALQAKAFGLRYFLGFTTSGLAVLLIGALYAGGGFPLVLGAASAFGALVFLSAVAFAAVTQRAPAAAAPAE